MVSGNENNPSSYVHPEVRLRIAQKELVQNCHRIFELCEQLNLDPDSLSAGWVKADIGITQEVVDAAPAKLMSGGGKLERMMPVAEMLEFHIKKHVLLMKKIEDVKNEKELIPREWSPDGVFHWCDNCDQIFGCDARAKGDKIKCTHCGHSGVF